MWKKLIGMLQKLVIGRALDEVKDLKSKYDWKKTGWKVAQAALMAGIAVAIESTTDVDSKYLIPGAVAGLKLLQDYLKHK